MKKGWAANRAGAKLSTGEEHYITFPEPTYAFWEGSNPEFNTTTLRV